MCHGASNDREGKGHRGERLQNDLRLTRSATAAGCSRSRPLGAGSSCLETSMQPGGASIGGCTRQLCPRGRSSHGTPHRGIGHARYAAGSGARVLKRQIAVPGRAALCNRGAIRIIWAAFPKHSPGAKAHACTNRRQAFHYGPPPRRGPAAVPRPAVSALTGSKSLFSTILHLSFPYTVRTVSCPGVAEDLS